MNNYFTVLIKVESADLAKFSSTFFDRCLINFINKEFKILELDSKHDSSDDDDKDTVTITAKINYLTEVKLDSDFIDRSIRRELGDCIKDVFKNHLHSLIFKITKFEVVPDLITVHS